MPDRFTIPEHLDRDIDPDDMPPCTATYCVREDYRLGFPKEDQSKCANCFREICSNCRIAGVGENEYYCHECFVCDWHKRPAVDCCVLCGIPVCAECSRPENLEDPGHCGVVCSPMCPCDAGEQPAPVWTPEQLNEVCPF
jgi:hypothetical protein